MRPKKRSLTLNGHRTSVSLEDEFWSAFCEIAASQKKAINRLAAEIDASRIGDAGLASTIRLYVLKFYRDRVPSNVSASEITPQAQPQMASAY